MTEKDAILEKYAGNEMRKLKNVCDKVLLGKEFYEVCDRDKDDFYSIGLEVLMKSVEDFDDTKNVKFSTFIHGNLRRKFLSYWLRDSQAQKKIPRSAMISTDEKVNNDESDATIGMLIESDFNLEDEVGLNDSTDRVDKYMSQLTDTQKKIARLIIDGYSITDTQAMLGLDDNRFKQCLLHMRTSANKELLQGTNNIVVKDLEEDSIVVNNMMGTQEKSKTDKYSVTRIINDIKNSKLLYNHPLQRESDQWSTKTKSNLISDILQGNPIPALTFAEQNMKGFCVIWNIDGKQRSTTAKQFVNNEFKIARNVTRNEIVYQEIEIDENGNVVVDNDGVPVNTWKTFNIVNKKFSDLPSVLQDKILNYCFEVVLYMNCSEEDIAYHINRYNDGKPMGKAQKSVLKLGSHIARKVKEIAAMSFFKDNGFKFKELNTGVIDRVVVETVMATEFIDDWKKNPEDMSEYVSNNSSDEMFENVEDTVDRLENVVDDTTGDLFTSKDAFVWFTVFNNFKNMNEYEDKVFNDFLTTFMNSLSGTVVNDITWEDWSINKCTKDKATVIGKINYIMTTLNMYLSNLDDKGVA